MPHPEADNTEVCSDDTLFNTPSLPSFQLASSSDNENYQGDFLYITFVMIFIKTIIL